MSRLAWFARAARHFLLGHTWGIERIGGVMRFEQRCTHCGIWRDSI